MCQQVMDFKKILTCKLMHGWLPTGNIKRIPRLLIPGHDAPMCVSIKSDKRLCSGSGGWLKCKFPLHVVDVYVWIMTKEMN